MIIDTLTSKIFTATIRPEKTVFVPLTNIDEINKAISGLDDKYEDHVRVLYDKTKNLTTEGNGDKYLADDGVYKEVKSLNLENGKGVGSIKAIYDTENGPVGSSGTTNESYKPEAEGKNGVALTPRAYANGDCAIAGGWSASANTKGDVALSAGQAGIATETEFEKEYPGGYPYRTTTRAEKITVPQGETYFYSTNNPSTNNRVIHYLTYAGFKALIQNSAFAACGGKALSIKSSAIGDGTVAHEGQAVIGKFNTEAAAMYEDGYLSSKDAIAIIGNGTANEDRCNGIEVYRNHVKSKIRPTHSDDIVRLSELKNKVTGYFGTKHYDENGNVIYDNTHTQIIRSDVSVLYEIDENQNPILENGEPIGGSFYANKQIHSPRVIADYINAENITVGSETNSGHINLVGPTANVTINGKPITSGGSNVTVDSELSTGSENPVQNKVVTEALDNKVEKGTGTKNTVYGRFNGEDIQINLTSIVSDTMNVNGTVPKYAVNNLFAGTPTNEFHVANKKYVDKNKGTKLYKHTLTGHIENTGDGLYFNVEFYSFSADVDYEIVGDYLGCDLLIHTDSVFLAGPFIGTNILPNPEAYEDASSYGYANAKICELHFAENYDWNGEYVSHTIEHEVVGV